MTTQISVAPADVRRVLLLLLLLITIPQDSQAVLCSIFKRQSTCEKMYTDSGACLWDSETGLCKPGGAPLPPGTVGIALAELDPDSAPLEIKPGPSSSSGSVSLREAPLASPSNVSAAEGPAPPSGEGDTPSPVLSDGASTMKQLQAVNADMIGNAGDVKPEEQVPVNNMFCSMPAEAGPCRAAFPRWYWNASSKKCENFIYGGCEGNANNFGTERECQDAAGKWCQSVAPAPEGIVAYSSYHPLNPVVTVLLSLCFAILLLSSGGQCLLL